MRSWARIGVVVSVSIALAVPVAAAIPSLIAIAAAAAALGAGGGRSAAPAPAEIAVVRTDGRIVLVNPAGRRLAVLTPRQGPRTSSWSPAWSPDGRRIAFARTTDARRSFHVYVMDADGSGVRQLTHGRFDEDPAWSPDGRWIAYASERGLRVVRPDGRGTRTVKGTGIATANCSQAFASTPSWAPAGRLSYAFHAETALDWPASCKRAGAHCGWVVTVRLDGSDRRAVARGRDAHWSPRGSDVVYTPPDGGVATVHAHGGKPRPLGHGYLADWSADGRQIVYARLGLGATGDSIWLMNADGSRPHRIVAGASMPAWRPGYGG